MTPSPEVVQLLRDIQTEIHAGVMAPPRSEAEQGHNKACARACRIIENYIGGYGLFQMTKPTRPAPRPDNLTEPDPANPNKKGAPDA